MGTTLTHRAVLERGEKLYFERLREELEEGHYGEYAIIDVASGEYVVHPHKLTAVETAQARFGKKLFYIVQIGDVHEPTINFREQKNVAWLFQE